ncbi:hypothetical protein QBC44DRAFT_36425 [Cladorrhinum sp. PSN332]|nr:hypothetical protein QBC44DRAFT_36425 [Cladorrhinum sp. PSN332]
MLFPIPAALLALFVSSALANDPTVTLSETKVTFRGKTTTNSIEHFLGIRYAHDTSGSRRFAPPEPYSYPKGTIVDATSPGPACPQSKPGIPPFFVDTPIISEDCLSLRISRPAGTRKNANLPVVVHLHGGGVVKGSAYDPHFDPDNLLRLSSSLEKPIIYVAINYRLTIFGFARLPILKDQKSLNVGMRDQRAAFEWVKANIASFGGDPNRITSFGLSSGGTFTSLHLISYGGKKGVPFTRAWAMSGPPGTALNMTSGMTEHHTRAVAEKVGCQHSINTTEDDGSDDGSSLLRCLRQIPLEELTEKAMEYSVANRPPSGLFTFIPSVDGDFIPASQTSLYRSGSFVSGIPFVYGYTQDDGALNVGPASLYSTEEDMIPVIKSVAPSITSDSLAHLLALYPASDFEQEVSNYNSRRKQDTDPEVSAQYFRASRIMRDLLFTCSSLDFGRHMAAAAAAAAADAAAESHKNGIKNSKVYIYALNQSMLAPIFAGAGMPYIRVPHGSDTNYLFDGVFPEGEVSKGDKKLSREVAGRFVEFAWGGRPGKGWPEAFSSKEEGFELMVVGGPWGSGSVKVRRDGKDKKKEGLAEMESGEEGEGEGRIDQVRLGEMRSRESRERERQVLRERLLERCEFVNSLNRELGI